MAHSVITPGPRRAVRSACAFNVRATYSRKFKETHIERQPIVLRRKSNLGSLGEIKHVPGPGRDFLAGLIRDFEMAFDNDLHLVVVVLVDKRSAFFQTVEAAGDWFLGIVLVT